MACLLRACARSCRICLRQNRQDRRSAERRIKIPIKVQLCRTFYSPRCRVAAAPAVQGRGGIVFGFSGTENVSKDSVPWTSRQRIKFVIVRCPVSGRLNASLVDDLEHPCNVAAEFR